MFHVFFVLIAFISFADFGKAVSVRHLCNLVLVQRSTKLAGKKELGYDVKVETSKKTKLPKLPLPSRPPGTRHGIRQTLAENRNER